MVFIVVAAVERRQNEVLLNFCVSSFEQVLNSNVPTAISC